MLLIKMLLQSIRFYCLSLRTWLKRGLP